jgi:hypothetical protein
MGVLYVRDGGAWVPIGVPVDEVWVGPNEPVTSDAELWVDSDATPSPTLNAKIGGNWTAVSSGAGGGGSDEVFVGPDTPPAGTEELWYDTDEGAANPAVNYWNTAWGVIAKGTFVANPVPVAASQADLTVGNMTATTVAGRRYQVRVFCNAFGTGGGPVTGNFQLQVDGAASPSGSWNRTTDNYGNCHANWILENLAAGAHSFRLRFDNSAGVTANLYNDGGHILLEDLGPITVAQVEPSSQAPPTTVASGNALGIVAVGSFSATGAPTNLPAATLTQITNALPFTRQVGRRYRVVIRTRAMYSTAAVYMSLYLRDGTTNLLAASTIVWVPASAQAYDAMTYDWLLDGDGVARSYNVAVQPGGTAVSLWAETASWFYIEDVGPNQTPALPVPATPPAWTPMGSLQNGWVYQGSGSQCMYRKIGDMVSVRGCIKNPTAMTLPSSSTFFTMPVGFRIPVSGNMPCCSVGSDAWGGLGLIAVGADGTLAVVRAAGVPGTSPHLWTDFNFSYSVTA